MTKIDYYSIINKNVRTCRKGRNSRVINKIRKETFAEIKKITEQKKDFKNKLKAIKRKITNE